MFADASTLISLDVVVCTYNRAADLDRVLAALACQEPTENVDWSVLVVDNASTDTTAEVVEAWRVRGGLPRLRRVLETEQGLSAARLRGVQETTAEWIAFVDDDNLLAPDWIRALGRAIAARPHAGGFGGRVVIDWGREPPRYFRSFGWCFAEQDYGAAERALESLVGAGMVLRRQALLASGWTEGPLLADRVGTRLVSGGDVEITQRVLGSGYELWYAPECILRHRIPPERITRRYLIRVAYGLGAGAAAVSALMWRQSYAEWLRDAKHKRRRFALQALRWIDPSPPRHIAPSAALADIAFAIGFARGMAVARARFRAP
jgi:glycosyltransferase involved in cell wall biosynthesis